MSLCRKLVLFTGNFFFVLAIQNAKAEIIHAEEKTIPQQEKAVNTVDSKKVHVETKSSKASTEVLEKRKMRKLKHHEFMGK